MPFNNYPYTDLNDINLDFILGKIGKLDESVTAAEAAAQHAEETIAGMEEYADRAEAAAEDAEDSAEAAAESAASITEMLWFGTPEMYGAVGDGVTDDYEAIASALEHYDVVVFRSNYYSSQTISIPSDKMLFIPGTIKSNQNPIININGSTHIRIYGGHIQGDGIANQSGISVYGTHDVIIIGVCVENCLNKGIQIVASYECSVDNCIVTGCNGQTGAGISVASTATETSPGVYVYNHAYRVSVSNIKSRNNRIGVIFQGCLNCTLDGLSSDHDTLMGLCYDGIITGSGDGAKHCTFNNVTVTDVTDATYSGIYFGNGSEYISGSDFTVTGENCAGVRSLSDNQSKPIHDIHLTNGTVIVGANYGIQPSITNDMTIENCYIHAALRGVSTYICNRITVSNSHVYGCSGAGIFIQASTRCCVIGCFCNNNGRDIQVAYGADITPVNTRIIGNSLTSATTVDHGSIAIITAGNEGV